MSFCLCLLAWGKPYQQILCKDVTLTLPIKTESTLPTGIRFTVSIPVRAIDNIQGYSQCKLSPSRTPSFKTEPCVLCVCKCGKFGTRVSNILRPLCGRPKLIPSRISSDPYADLERHYPADCKSHDPGRKLANLVQHGTKLARMHTAA